MRISKAVWRNVKMRMVEILILAYIDKYHRLDLYEIQKVVNEPVSMLARTASAMYEVGYIARVDEDCFVVRDFARKEAVGSWMWKEWTPRYKEEHKALPFYEERAIPSHHELRTNLNVVKEFFYSEGINLSSYHEFVLITPSKVRLIAAPGRPLKLRQVWILKNMLECVEIPECVHGFVKNRSIKTNAMCHVGKNQVLCLDLADFFPSIHEAKVKKVFEKLGCTEKVADFYTRLCTWRGKLPQGAPTSPYLANLVFDPIDYILMEFAEKHDLVYTRYADDLTFSADFGLEKLQEKIITLIEENGFQVNKKKTHIMEKPYRKIITGLIVTDEVRVPKRFKKKLRQEIYYCRKYGIAQHLETTGRTSAVNFREYLYGKAYFIKMVEPEVGENFLSQLDELFAAQGIS